MDSFQDLMQCLPQYLEEHNIEANGKFCCPFPDHDDRTPSAHVYKGVLVKCFGCGGVATIFDLAHMLENLPAKGQPDYYRDNVCQLAKRYGIVLPAWAESPVMDLLAFIVSYTLGDYAEESAKKKGLSKKDLLASWAVHDSLQEFQHDNVPLALRMPSYNTIRQLALEAGHSEFTIKHTGITPELLPEDNTLVYPLWQANGVPIALMSRSANSYGPSHYNTHNNECFTKGKYCYGLHKNFDPSLPLWVVEGPKDAWALWSAGHQAVAILTSNISSDQLDLLLAKRFTKLIFALDGDNAGAKGIKRGINDALKKGVLVDVCIWPNGSDAYNVIIDEKAEIPETQPGLSYLVEEMMDQNDEGYVCDEMINIVASIESNLKRTAIAKDVALILNVDKDDFIADLRQEVERRASAANQKAMSLFERALEKGRQDPSNINSHIATALEHAKNLSIRTSQYDNGFLIGLLGDIQSGTADKSARDVHFRKNGLGVLTDTLHEGGIGHTEGILLTVGGDPHTGKTALLLQSMIEWLLHDDDTMCIHFSTDDSTQMLLPRLGSALVFDPDFRIANMAKQPSTAHIYRQRTAALNQISKWAQEDRLIMKDQNFSRRLGDAANLVKFYRDRYPDRRILFVNDNMHRNTDYLHLDSNTQIELLSGDGKDLAVCENLAVWAAVEYRKNKAERGLVRIKGPSNADIAGGRAIQYHTNVIIGLFNDLIDKNGDIQQSVFVHEHAGELFPRVMLMVSKNKVSGTTGVIPMNLFSKSSFFTYADPAQVEADMVARAEELGVDLK